METHDILYISFSAFVVVFSVLSALAIFMLGIMKLFPAKDKKDDISVYSAIAAAHSAIYPGTKIKKIEEIK